MTDEERQRGAQALLDMPIFHELWDEMEKQAMMSCVHSKPTDHDARAAHAAEARAIIAFRNKLKGMAQASASGRQAPA